MKTAPSLEGGEGSVTDAMVYAFHRSMSDGALGEADFNEIRDGLRVAPQRAPATGDEREPLSDERIKEIGLQHGFMCVEDGRVFVCSHTYGGMVDSLRSLLQASAAHRREDQRDGVNVEAAARTLAECME